MYLLVYLFYGGTSKFLNAILTIIHNQIVAT